MVVSMQDAARSAGQRADELISETQPIAGEVFSIEGKAFVVKKMKFKPLVALFSLFTREMKNLAKSGLLTGDFISKLMRAGDRLFETSIYASGEATETDLIAQLVELIGELGETLPVFVEQVLAMMLGAKSKVDSEYIYENIDFDQVAPILAAWMKFNPWRDLINQLFLLWREVEKEIQTTQPNLTTPSESSMNLPLVAMVETVETT